MSIARTEDDAPRGFVRAADYYRALAKINELEARITELRDEERERIDDCAVGVVRVRLRCSTQQAKLLIAMVHARAPIVSKEYLREATEAPQHSQINVIAHRLNKIGKYMGGVRLMRGFPGKGSGGFALLPEGRAWLSERIPELFDKGAAR